MAPLDRGQLALAQTGWMALVAAVLVVFGAFDVALFLSAAFASLLVLAEAATPRGDRPPWVTRLRWFAVAGLVVFSAYVAYRLVLLAPPGVL